MNKYIVYQVHTHPFNPELISNALLKFELRGLLEEENHINIYLSEETQITENILTYEFEKLQSEMLIETFSIEKEILEDKNWNELWEKTREVIRVTEKMVIKPSCKDFIAKEGEIVLTIDPKMSFGTGEHQTTKLVLRLMEKYVRPGMKILDVGAGTGILSIAAIKLGADFAIAIDNDELCYDNCIENCELNGVTKFVKILTAEIKDVRENDFDLILANIQRDVLLEISGEVKKRLSEKNIIILSGLLEQNFDEIVNHYSQTGFKFIEKQTMNEWIALAFKLSSSK
jgi:ribosomal protein L11 methyltransferase